MVVVVMGEPRELLGSATRGQECTSPAQPEWSRCPLQTYNHTRQKPLVSNPFLWLRKNKGVSEITQYVHDKVGARTHTSGPSSPPVSPNREAMAPSTSLSRAVLCIRGHVHPPRCCDNNSTLPTFSNTPPSPEGGGMTFTARR